jgi:F5/8 type C domain
VALDARRTRLGIALLLFGLSMEARQGFAQVTVIDDFEKPGGWTTSASEGATVQISQDTGHTGMAMRVDFDLPKEGGYAIVRKEVDLTLPENYAFTFQLRGTGPRNNVEFKLVDPSGKSVWWRVQRDFTFPPEWQPVTIRKARIKLAWGAPPTPKRIGAIEFAVTSGNGGKGTVWIDDLVFEEREPTSQYRRTAKVSASSSIEGHAPERALDDDPATSWHSEAAPEEQSLTIDFVRQRDYGGLRIDWDPQDYATEYKVENSDDGEKWVSAFVVAAGKGGHDYVYMPDAESRYLRLTMTKSSRGQGYGIFGIAIQPLEFSDTPNQFFQALAAESAPGTFPKYFYGKQTYWTVVGVDGDEKNALLNEEGMLEVEKGRFSIEPFLYADGKLLDWSAARTAQALDGGYLPIPSVRWEADGLALHVTAFAAGDPGSSTLYALYRVENLRDDARHVQLFLALRPFQVDPPWQSLNMIGGVAPIHTIRFDADTAWINRDQPVILAKAPDRFGATSFEQGRLTDFLRAGSVPPHTAASDRFGFASAAMEYALDIAPLGKTEVAVAVPFHPGDSFTPPSANMFQEIRGLLEDTRHLWQQRLEHVGIEVPIEAERFAHTLRSTLGYILVNRDGPRLQPGPRNYARSWIRDGALTSAALLQMGFTREPRAFLEWYAPYQMPDGKVPCCVDHRGADPVAENDSNGEFVYAVAEIYRYTHDIGFLTEMWPRVVRAVEYLDALRRQRTTDAFREPGKEKFYGLLPASISHEGYASRPVHSYWDDFFALRAFKDAAMLAAAMGDDEHAATFARLRDSFHSDLYSSLARTIEEQAIDYVPGSAELGDFDPSSTAIALDPGGEIGSLPRRPLERTFEKYYEVFRARRDGSDWDAFAPYEMRIADALVRLDRRDQALQVLEYMLANQRPTGWNEWQEIVWRDPTAASFIGDMPHTWVASSFVRAMRTMFAYESEPDQALVLAAGVPRAWVIGGKHAGVRRLPTYYGVLSYRLESDGPDRLRMQISGDVRVPPGKVVIRPPLERPLQTVRVNGRSIDTFTADQAVISELPANVVLDSSSAGQPTPTPRPTPTPTASPEPTATELEATTTPTEPAGTTTPTEPPKE